MYLQKHVSDSFRSMSLTRLSDTQIDSAKLTAETKHNALVTVTVSLSKVLCPVTVCFRKVARNRRGPNPCSWHGFLCRHTLFPPCTACALYLSRHHPPCTVPCTVCALSLSRDQHTTCSTNTVHPHFWDNASGRILRSIRSDDTNHNSSVVSPLNNTRYTYYIYSS